MFQEDQIAITEAASMAEQIVPRIITRKAYYHLSGPAHDTPSGLTLLLECLVFHTLRRLAGETSTGSLMYPREKPMVFNTFYNCPLSFSESLRTWSQKLASQLQP